MGEAFPVPISDENAVDISNRNVHETCKVHWSTPNAEFDITISPEDFEYAPRLVAKLEEFAHKCGFAYLKFRRATDDPSVFEWTDRAPH